MRGYEKYCDIVDAIGYEAMCDYELSSLCDYIAKK